MALNVTHHEREGVAILDLHGRITLGEGDLVLRSEIDQVLSTGQNRMVLNLGKVTHIDTAGLGTLLRARADLAGAGGGLALANLHPVHLTLLVLAKLEFIFEIFEDEQEAVNSYYPDRKVNTFDVLSFVRQMKKEDEE